MSRSMLSLWGLLAVHASAFAADDVPRAFLNKHCVECHREKVAKGDLRLDDLAADFKKAETREHWKGVRDRLAAGTMPPEKKPRPSTGEVDKVIAWIDAGIGTFERERFKVEGRTPLRRLNRIEYENTLRDLLGVTVDVRELLPEDALRHGFDNLGEALSVSPTQMLRYLEASEIALNAAIATGPKPPANKKTYSLADGRGANNIGKHWLKRPDGAIVVFTAATFPGTNFDGFRATAPGKYRITIHAEVHQGQAAIPCALITGNFGRGSDTRIEEYYEFAPGPKQSVTTTLPLEPGDGVQVQIVKLGNGFNVYKKDNPDTPEAYKGPGLAFHGLEIEGPLYDEWPPRGHVLLFGELPILPPANTPKGKVVKGEPTSKDPLADAKKLLPGFLSKAFRRPLKAAEAEPYLKLFEAQMKAGASFVVAMKAAAAAALAAPDFIYLKETPGPLNDHALAARLSYFLTRSMPDAELSKLAAKGTLHEPAVLRAQTERLLATPASKRFITDFADAWLDLRNIDFTTPDRALYPEFDALLQDAMLKETRAFITEVLTQNLPAATFVQSDFAMLNERLAKHYKLPPVEGLAIRKVALPAGSVRGGLLTQGAVLKVSANGSNTSPVVRGVYVLERFLGQSPPPPPPGVPAVEPDIRGAKTIRELLAKHRATETCAGCHRMIDPPGFALECFDVIGGERDKFRVMKDPKKSAMKVDGEFVRYAYGLPVDASGELTDGRQFKNFAEFRLILVKQPERFARCFVEKLMTFATGREADAADRPTIDAILAAAKAKNYPVRDLVHAVVQSETFRTK